MSAAPPVHQNGFFVNPDRYYAPSYRLSPFCTADIAANRALAPSDACLSWLSQRFAPKAWRFTSCGKEALALSLRALALAADDSITIVTTSGNRYVSRCVTDEIEKVCRWSRAFAPRPSAILVIHEFGHPYRELASLRAYGVPIIEDACHSFLADTRDQSLGRVGDFVLFSLPKVFPMQAGGILVHGRDLAIRSSVDEDAAFARTLQTLVSHHHVGVDEIRVRRRAHYAALAARFAEMGCRPRFPLLAHDVPGAFLFTVEPDVDLDAMKAHGWRHGIECSVFYGERAFFVPVHQRLAEADLDYFQLVFGRFLSGAA